MFRLSQYLSDIAGAPGVAHSVAPGVTRDATTSPVAAPGGSHSGRVGGGNRAAPGPVVIWNLVRRCNLTCKHCYSISADKDFAGELSTGEVFTVLDELRAARVPVVILSGGEPLLRPDLFDIAARAKALRFFVALSTNGTLIDAPLADRIAAAGFDYVGISLDGIGATHDRFRRLDGAFDRSLAALRLLRDRDVRVGVRYTMTEHNAGDLPALLQMCEDEGFAKFYFSHLNYAGRGNKHRADDARHRTTRAAMDLLFETGWRWVQDDRGSGQRREIVTGNNDADAVYLLHWLRRRFPDLPGEHLAALRARLVAWGGNASGVAVANIDNQGDVHPDTMWWHHTLGNVRTRRFGDIWGDLTDPLMAGLKQRPRPVQGRCGACAYLDVCNGNTRVRAQQTTGDAWAEDPGCYLDDAELGLVAQPAAEAA